MLPPGSVAAQTHHPWRPRRWDVPSPVEAQALGHLPCCPQDSSPVTVPSLVGENGSTLMRPVYLPFVFILGDAHSYPMPFFLLCFSPWKAFFNTFLLFELQMLFLTLSFAFQTPFQLPKFRCLLESKSISLHFLAFWRAWLVVSNHWKNQGVLNLLRVTEVH